MTVVPPAGAAVVSVTVAALEFVPSTVVGVKLIPNNVADVIVSAADFVVPFNVATIFAVV